MTTMLQASVPADWINTLGTSLSLLWPVIAITATLFLVLTLSLFGKWGTRLAPAIILIGLGWALILTFNQPVGYDLEALGLGSNTASKYLMLLIVGSAIGITLFAWAYPPLQRLSADADARHGRAEFWVLFLAMVLGALTLCLSRHLLLSYLALELVSIPSYILAGYFRTRAGSEAAVKYAIYGATSSALLLFGISLAYGLSGSLFIADALPNDAGLAGYIAITFLVVGIAFKLAAAPLHFWAPDVYQGSASPVAALLATVSKLAGLALLVQVLDTRDLLSDSVSLFALMPVLAFLSLTIGTLAALRQTDYRRLLAYSGISQMGFLLLGASTIQPTGVPALLFFAFAYVLTSLGVFVAGSLCAEATGSTNWQHWGGLGRRHPYLAGGLSVLLVGLTGLPPTVGFIAKLYVFLPLITDYQDFNLWHSLVLLMSGLLYTVIALAVYLRPVARLFFGTSHVQGWHYLEAWHHRLRLGMVLLLAAATIWFGLRDFDRLVNFLSN